MSDPEKPAAPAPEGVPEKVVVLDQEPTSPAPRPPRLSIPPRWSYAVWGLTTVVFVGAVIWLATSVDTVAVPLLTAFIIAYLLDPVVDRLEVRGIPRAPAIGLILGAFLLVLFLALLFVVPQVVRQLAEVPEKLQQLIAAAVPWAEKTLGLDVPTDVESILAELQQQIAAVDVRALAAPVGSVFAIAAGGTRAALAVLAALVMVPVFAFYLLRDFDVIIARVDELIPAHLRPPVKARFAEIDLAMGSFIRGQLTVASILAVLYSVGLWAVGLPLALVVGVIAGLGNMIPYLGTALGIALATLMVVLDWQGFGQLALVYGVFLVVQGLEGWVITPRVVGESVGLSPFVVIVAVLAFGELFGFVGVLLAVPLAAILKILLRVALEAYQGSSFYRATRTSAETSPSLEPH